VTVPAQARTHHINAAAATDVAGGAAANSYVYGYYSAEYPYYQDGNVVYAGPLSSQRGRLAS
jgi:hypothetical protein